MINEHKALGFFAFWDSTKSVCYANKKGKLLTSSETSSALDKAKECGVKMFGHYNCRWSAEKSAFTFWWVPTFDILENIMDDLERAGVFLFAISECRIGFAVSDTDQLDRDMFVYEGGTQECPYAFTAFWSWKDSYYRASTTEITEYNKAVAEAFKYARTMGIKMLGKYNCAATSKWDHFTFWLSPTFAAIEETMDLLEEAGDFMFAESKHMLGYLDRKNSFGRSLYTAL